MLRGFFGGRDCLGSLLPHAWGVFKGCRQVLENTIQDAVRGPVSRTAEQSLWDGLKSFGFWVTAFREYDDDVRYLG